MHIIWSRLSSPNLICSTDFSLLMQKKKKNMLKNGSIATDCNHYFGQNSGPSYIGTHQLLVSAKTFFFRNNFHEII